MKRVDPFAIKERLKLDPVRLSYTIYARAVELYAGFLFQRYEIPLVLPKDLEPDARVDLDDTDVNAEQLSVLRYALNSCEQVEGDCVEVGAYKGVTTAGLSTCTSRQYFAVDPFFGWGGADSEYRAFISRTQHLGNVIHIRRTSGAALEQFQSAKLAFVFIDAVHDYVNAKFDGESWGELLKEGGMLAFHDADNQRYAGVRKAINEFLSSGSYELFAHVDGLVVLRKQL